MRYNLFLSTGEIVDLITKYLNIKAKAVGKNVFFSCPFHIETTPSFCFNTTFSSFKCYGCSKFNNGYFGDVVKFLSSFKKISEMEAVKEISELFGISLAERLLEEKKDDEKEKFSDYLTLINNIYQYNLTVKEGSNVLRYLKKKRKISGDTARSFSLGCTINNKQICSTLLKIELFHSFNQKMSSFWRIDKEGNEILDLFPRFSLTIPLINDEGKIVSWATRSTMPRSNEIKYFFLPNYDLGFTKVNKSDILFNYWRVKQTTEEEVFLVEGFFDVMSLFQKGVKNSLALLGTSISSKQLKKLINLKKKIVLFLDNDQAGREATIKIISLLLLLDQDCEVVNYGENLENLEKDPDDFCKENDSNLIQKKIKNRTNPFLYIIEHYYEEYSLITNPHKTGTFLRKLLDTLKEKRIRSDFVLRKLEEVTLWKKTEIEEFLFRCSKLMISFYVFLANFCFNELEKIEREIIELTFISKKSWIYLLCRNFSFFNLNKEKKYWEVSNYYGKKTTITSIEKASNTENVLSSTILNDTIFLIKKRDNTWKFLKSIDCLFGLNFSNYCVSQ